MSVSRHFPTFLRLWNASKKPLAFAISGLKAVNWRIPVPARRVASGAFLSALLIVGIGFLPGRIEGQYPDVGIRCMCDCVNFLQFRDGRIIYYAGGHPPARMIGRYSENADGAIDMFFDYGHGETGGTPDRAYPGVFFTRFSWSGGEEVERGIKHPRILRVGKAISAQEITSQSIGEDRSVTTTYYDRALEPVRTERAPPRQHRVSE